MTKFRKKPGVIEAITVRSLIGGAESGSFPDISDQLFEAVANAHEVGDLTIADDLNSITIRTLEGDHRGEIDDWLIMGIKGELYPCKPDIFEKTYEAVTA